jgi:hypothetical protein
MAEKQYRKNVELAQSVIPEPVLTAAMFQHAGSFSAGLFSGISHEVGFRMNRDGKKNSGGFPHESIIALTDTKIYAFSVKGGLKFKIKDPIGSWDRSSVSIQTSDGKATVLVKFDFGADGVAVLETQKLAAHAGNLHFVEAVISAAAG